MLLVTARIVLLPVRLVDLLSDIAAFTFLRSFTFCTTFIPPLPRLRYYYVPGLVDLDVVRGSALRLLFCHDRLPLPHYAICLRSFLRSFVAVPVLRSCVRSCCCCRVCQLPHGSAVLVPFPFDYVFFTLHYPTFAVPRALDTLPSPPFPPRFPSIPAHAVPFTTHYGSHLQFCRSFFIAARFVATRATFDLRSLRLPARLVVVVRYCLYLRWFQLVVTFVRSPWLVRAVPHCCLRSPLRSLAQFLPLLPAVLV